jgi:hypothetical protein
MRASGISLVSAIVFFTAAVFAGTTGKIAGTVTDARTGEPLPSVNITLEKTNLGAATNVDGYFVILNVPPGRYRLTAKLIGYKAESVIDIRVDIDQTTTQNIKLSEEAIAGEEVTVVATRPIVQRDVAASRANIEISDIDKLPVNSVTAAVGLQAGVEGLSVRMGTIDQTLFVVDGMLLRDARTNNPYSSVALSAVQDVQIQTGGFNAEYGNVRSGIVNVVTREGGKSSYSLNFQGRYSPAQPKHFGVPIYDRSSYYIRPFVDPDVCWTGTGRLYDPGAWDYWTRAQYPTFEGWNSVSQKTLTDSDPKNDLTPQGAQQVFLWQHRRQPEITAPDFDIDAGFGGPIPGGEALGNLRFFASYRGSRSYYLIPLSVPSYDDQNGQLKITADLTPTMKLTLNGMLGQQTGTNSNNTGEQGLFTSVGGVAGVLSQVSYIDARIFSNAYWAPSKIRTWMGGAKLSHSLSPTTYYDATVQYFQQRTDTNPGKVRDTSAAIVIGNGYVLDMAPIDYWMWPSTGIDGLRMGVGFSNSRDTSIASTLTARFDITSQLDRYNQVKGGFEFNYTDNNIRSGNIDVYLPSGRYDTRWHSFPIRVSAYAQDKLEFEGMIVNLGLRLDYLNANEDWYTNFDPYNKAFSTLSLGIDTLLEKNRVKPQWNLSPRLGVSFPVSEVSKFFFNYGHFRQIPDPRNLYLIRRYRDNNQVTALADPTEPLQRTIQYELGYEHSLFDEFLVRIAAYYKDITHETFSVQYLGRGNVVNYSTYTSNRYRDIRGFEITVNKNRGNWIQGFVNYTYDVGTAGYFGLREYAENQQTQAAILREQIYQEKPIPSPYARLNIDFFTPNNWGPEVLGINPLDNWRVNLTGTWDAGGYFTWTGGTTIPGIQNNVQWRDYWDFYTRISKTFRVGKLGVELRADIYNLFNVKRMSTAYGWPTGTDFQNYMASLHMPQKIYDEIVTGDPTFDYVAGDDRPGDYRKNGAAYYPILSVSTMNRLVTGGDQYKQTKPFYYVRETGMYYRYENGAYWPNDPGVGLLKRVLDDRAYIDMPNQESFTFLNPRRIFFGIRLSYDM